MQCVEVGDEVERNKIQDHPDSCPMAAVDEAHKLRGFAVAAISAKIAGGLISPGSVQGMLCQRQKFNMRISHVLDIRDQVICQFIIR